MSKKTREFRPGLIYVFTKKKFIKDMGKSKYKTNKCWVDKCNGQIVEVVNVKFGTAIGTDVHIDWCKCIGRSERKCLPRFKKISLFSACRWQRE